MTYQLFQNQRFFCLISPSWRFVGSATEILSGGTIAEPAGFEIARGDLQLTETTTGRRSVTEVTITCSLTDQEIDYLKRFPITLVIPQFSELLVIEGLTLLSVPTVVRSTGSSTTSQWQLKGHDVKRRTGALTAIQLDEEAEIVTSCPDWDLETIVRIDWCELTPQIERALSVDRPAVLNGTEQKRLIFTSGLQIPLTAIPVLTESEYIVIKLSPGRWQHQISARIPSVQLLLITAAAAERRLLVILTRADGSRTLIAPARVTVTQTNGEGAIRFISASADSIPVTINTVAVTEGEQN